MKELTPEEQEDLKNRVEQFIEDVKGLSAKYKLNMRAVIKEDGPRFAFDNVVDKEEVSEVPGVPAQVVVDEPVKAE